MVRKGAAMRVNEEVINKSVRRLLERSPITQELTFEEKAVWGTCEHCGVGPGEFCVDDQHKQEGAHLVRILAAPKFRVITFHN